MTILEDLWYGNIDLHETVPNDDRHFKSMLALMGRNRDKLNNTLTEQQKESLAKYDYAVNELHYLAELSAFRYGFSLSVRLVMESVSIDLTVKE